MLEILIEGRPLYIAQGTSITMEQSSALFDIDNMTAEMVWTFDVPAARNEDLLSHAHHTLISAYRSYQCQLLYNGVRFAKGRLYAQTIIDQQSVSCGVVISDLPEGWGDTPLKNNPYTITTIATSPENHKDGWLRFLQDSLSPSSPVKFFLFASDQFSSRDHYGHYRGSPSPLFTHSNGYCHYVNRLFTDTYGSIVNLSPDQTPGLRVFGSDNGSGYHFCPAQNLLWLLRQTMQTAGYTTQGTFTTDPRIQQLFHQSLNALDADLMKSYNITSYLATTDASGIATNTPPADAFPVIIDGAAYPLINLSASSTPRIQYQLQLPTEGLSLGITDPSHGAPWDRYDDAFIIALLPADQPLPSQTYTLQQGNIHYCDQQPLLTPIDSNSFDLQFSQASTICYHILTSTSFQPSQTDEIYHSAAYTPPLPLAPGPYRIVIATTRIFTTAASLRLNHDTDSPEHWLHRRGQIRLLTDITPRTSLDSLDLIASPDGTVNIFSSAYNPAHHVPDLTNADLLKTLARAFGLAIFLSPDTHQIELTFFADIIDARAFDITPYVVSEKKQAYSQGHYKATLPTTLDQKEVSPEIIDPSVATRQNLPSARRRYGRQAFVQSENCYHSALYDDKNHRYAWQPARGNDAHLVIGDTSASPTEIKPDLEIPCMTMLDTEAPQAATTTHPVYLMNIPAQGASPLYDSDYDPSQPLRLTQYCGHQPLHPDLPPLATYEEDPVSHYDHSLGYDPVHQHNPLLTASIEQANPTCYNHDGTIDPDRLTLAATGQQSIGEIWLRPLYDFLAHKEDFELVLRINITTFLRLHRLIEPQDAPPHEQERWLYYKGRRFLPSRISYQFQSGLIEATITCHRRHLEN